MRDFVSRTAIILCCCQACPIIVMFALYTSRNQGKLQRACACGSPEIHGCKSGSFAPVVLHIELHGCRLRVSVPVVGFTCAHPAFLPPSFDSRVLIRPFCPPSFFSLNSTCIDPACLPRRPSLILSRTAARARSTQGASQFAAGYAAAGRATRIPLAISDLGIFRVVKTTTLISVK